MGVSKVIATAALAVLVAQSAAANVYTYELRPSAGLDRGTELLQTGNVEDAQRHYMQVLSGNPTPRQAARAYNGLCVSNIMTGEWASALEQCNQAIRVDPANWRYYNNRGNIYLEVGDFAKARAEYKRALDLAPQSITVQRNLELTDYRESYTGGRTGKLEQPV